MPRWRIELDILFTAITFLTRIPAPRWVGFEPAYLNQASRYFPWVGVLVGLCGWVVFAVSAAWFPPLVAVLLSIVATVLLTGAFHEDGFADLCDGFGGGWEKQQVLTIMKDSRLGTYGALGLGLMVASKAAVLVSLPIEWVGPALLMGHSASRLVAISYLYNYPYVQDAEASKVKPLATQLTARSLLFAALATLPVLFYLGAWTTLWLWVGLLLLRALFGRYLRRRIGGYTGDCLGAAQQLAELFIYLYLLAQFSPVSVSVVN